LSEIIPLLISYHVPDGTIQNVGTDTREYDVMAWTANTGVLKGAFIPFITNPLEADDLAFNVLATSVIGSISEHLLSGGGLTAANTRSAVGPVVGPQFQPTLGPQLRLPPSLRDLQGAFKAPPNLAEVLRAQAGRGRPSEQRSAVSIRLVGVAALFVIGGPVLVLPAVAGDGDACVKGR
jgi:hypothetical protein